MNKKKKELSDRHITVETLSDCVRAENHPAHCELHFLSSRIYDDPNLRKRTDHISYMIEPGKNFDAKKTGKLIAKHFVKRRAEFMDIVLSGQPRGMAYGYYCNQLIEGAKEFQKRTEVNPIYEKLFYTASIASSGAVGYNVASWPGVFVGGVFGEQIAKRVWSSARDFLTRVCNLEEHRYYAKKACRLVRGSLGR